MTPELSVRRDLLRRFHARVDRSGGNDACWLWTAGKTTAGYGELFTGAQGQDRGRVVLAHRVAWSIANGPIPAGLTIDHLCGTKACCNPTHLECVTQRVNILRSNGQSAVNARKTHCKWGHEFTPENTYVRTDNGSRVCKACDRNRRGYKPRPTRPDTDTLRALRARGLTYREIGALVGMSYSAVGERLVGRKRTRR